MDKDYILKKEELEPLVQYFKKPDDTKDPGDEKLRKSITDGFENVVKTKTTISESHGDIPWNHFEQAHFIYRHMDAYKDDPDQYKFNNRGICASMVLLMFNTGTYPETESDLIKLMEQVTSVKSLIDYGKIFDGELSIIPEKDKAELKWDLPPFVSFCEKVGFNIKEERCEDDLNAPWDLEKLGINQIYFIGEKAKVGKVQSAHVVLLTRTEKCWYLFDPTLGIFMIPTTDTANDILTIKTNARIEKVGGKVGSPVEGYRIFYLATKL